MSEIVVTYHHRGLLTIWAFQKLKWRDPEKEGILRRRRRQIGKLENRVIFYGFKCQQAILFPFKFESGDLIWQLRRTFCFFSIWKAVILNGSLPKRRIEQNWKKLSALKTTLLWIETMGELSKVIGSVWKEEEKTFTFWKSLSSVKKNYYGRTQPSYRGSRQVQGGEKGNYQRISKSPSWPSLHLVVVMNSNLDFPPNLFPKKRPVCIDLFFKQAPDSLACQIESITSWGILCCPTGNNFLIGFFRLNSNFQ